VLDGEAVDRLINTQKLDNLERLSTDEFYDALMKIDSQHGSKEWRSKFDGCKSGLATYLGFLSANQCIDTAKFFLENALIRSDMAKDIATRAVFVCLAFAAVSLDYALKDLSFRSSDERQEALKLGLRFGEGSNSSTLDPVRLAIGLVRQYAENGNALARQIETKFFEEAALVPAEIIAEFAARVGTTDHLFRAAKELDAVGHSNKSIRYDELSLEAKSFLGVALDYMALPRKKMADLLPLPSTLSKEKKAATSDGMLPLEEERKA